MENFTRINNTSHTFFQRFNKQTPFLSKFYPKYNQQRKNLKPRSGNVYNFSLSQVHQFIYV